MFNNQTGPKPVKDVFGAYLASEAEYTPQNQYPIIPSSFVYQDFPKKILPLDKALISKDDLSETFICTYENDDGFKRVRKNPTKFIEFFKKTAGIIGFDISIHSDMPLWKQCSFIGENLELTYFYGKQGIPIIPNIRYGIDETIPDFFKAIPLHSTLAIGTHGFIKFKFQKAEWFVSIEKIINELKPQRLVVYGSLNGKLFSKFYDMTQIKTFKAWFSLHMEEKKYGN